MRPQEIIRSVHTTRLFALYKPRNKQHLFLYTILTDWLLLPSHKDFTVRYEMNC
jgi:hypothetical protein